MLWGLFGALCCLLGAVDLALAGVNPFARPPDPLMGEDMPVSVCAVRHYTPGTPSTSSSAVSV
jgi:hypothetical protein